MEGLIQTMAFCFSDTSSSASGLRPEKGSERFMGALSRPDPKLDLCLVEFGHQHAASLYCDKAKT